MSFEGSVDSLDRRRAEAYRRAYIAHHERHRANGRIGLPRRPRPQLRVTASA